MFIPVVAPLCAPSQIGNIRTLTRLNVSNNRLRDFAASIGNVICIRVSPGSVIILGKKALFVHVVAMMHCLQELDVSFNDLKWLPDSLGNLCNMLRLNANNNQLKALPLSLGAASSLQALDLQDNVSTAP